MRQRCEMRQRMTTWNEINMHGEFTIRINKNNENGGNQEILNE